MAGPVRASTQFQVFCGEQHLVSNLELSLFAVGIRGSLFPCLGTGQTTAGFCQGILHTSAEVKACRCQFCGRRKVGNTGRVRGLSLKFEKESAGRVAVVDCKSCKLRMLPPIFLSVADKVTQRLLEKAVHPLILSIRLRMEYIAHAHMRAKTRHTSSGKGTVEPNVTV